MLLVRMRPSLMESDNSGLPVIQEFLRIDSHEPTYQYRSGVPMSVPALVRQWNCRSRSRS
jgi:hypothetical protein